MNPRLLPPNWELLTTPNGLWYAKHQIYGNEARLGYDDGHATPALAIDAAHNFQWALDEGVLKPRGTQLIQPILVFDTEPKRRRTPFHLLQVRWKKKRAKGRTKQLRQIAERARPKPRQAPPSPLIGWNGTQLSLFD